MKIERISIGKTDATLVDIKIIAKLALSYLASAIVVSHNHPSGNLTPSAADNQLTERIKGALNLLDIQLLDHIIIANDNYFSYADEGKL
jgi:DNA repair protein RadC